MSEIEEGLDEAGMAAAEFARQLDAFRGAAAGAGQSVDGLSRGLSRGLRRALDGLVYDGISASAALETVGRSLLDSVYSSAVRPVTKHFGGLLSKGLSGALGGLVPFADGGAFSQGRVMPFAKGGVVSGATTFPMRGGTGLMGEAGPEAILPLRRGADGRLGVAGGGGGGAQVTINVTTPDVEGFRRSRSQIAAEMGRAIASGARNR